MPTPIITVPCLRYAKIAKDIYEFTVKKPAGFAFKAGQFVLFHVPLLHNPSDVQTRAFSIASAPHEDDLLFVAKLKEGGRASEWIAKSLHVGSPVTLQGPFGLFTIKEDRQKDTLFLATSTGVAPFRSQIFDCLHRNDRRTMTMVFGVRAEEDLFWVDTFTALAQRHKTFAFHPALTQGSPSWQGKRGRILHVAREIVEDSSGQQLFVCGNPAMCKEVKEIALSIWKIPKEDVHVEGYI